MNSLLPTKATAAPPAPPPADYAAYGAPDDYGAPVASPIRIRRLLHFLRRFWWLPLLTLILSLAAAGAYVYYAPPEFVSRSRMWETEKLRLPDGAAFVGDLQNYYGTQMQLMQSARLLNLALARLQAAGSNAVPRGTDNLPLPVEVNVKQQLKSTVFLLEASSGDAAYSQAFLDALMAEYLSYKKNVRKVISGDTLNSISEQVLRLERELKDAQEAFTAFQRSNNLAILQEEGTISGGYLARLKTQLSDLELELRLLDATAAEQTNSFARTNTVAPFPVDPLRLTSSSGASAAVAESQAAFKQLEILKLQREKLTRYLKPKHPKIAKLDSEIDRGVKLAELYRNQSLDQLAASRQAVTMKLQSVNASIKEWETRVVASKNLIAEAERLKLAVTRSQTLYDRLALMLQNVDISRSVDQETLAVLEPASPAVRSYKKDLVILALAAIFGTGFGLALVFLIEIRDDRFTNVLEITDKFGDSVVGQVPEVKALRKAKNPDLLQELHVPHILAESYRNLRSALLFFPVENQRPKVLLITSPVPGEGKSTVAANLARTFAQGGASVLLIDADLRKGHLHDSLGLKKEPGLTNLLSNGATDPSQYLQDFPFSGTQGPRDLGTQGPTDSRTQGPKDLRTERSDNSQLTTHNSQLSTEPPSSVAPPSVLGPRSSVAQPADPGSPSPQSAICNLQSAISDAPSSVPGPPSSVAQPADPGSPSAQSAICHLPSAISGPPTSAAPTSVLGPPSSASAASQLSTFSSQLSAGRGRLDFLSRGSSTLRNPGDAFLNPAWDRALARWRTEYDYVLIDSPPVFAADDAGTLAPKADGTLLVVRRRFSRAGVTRRAIELLLQRQAKILGLIFNRADSSSPTYYYNIYPDYNSGGEPPQNP